jgi:hypothetical protein
MLLSGGGGGEAIGGGGTGKDGGWRCSGAQLRGPDGQDGERKCRTYEKENNDKERKEKERSESAQVKTSTETSGERTQWSQSRHSLE